MDVKCDVGVIGLHMKVHRHLRAMGVNPVDKSEKCHRPPWRCHNIWLQP